MILKNVKINGKNTNISIENGKIAAFGEINSAKESIDMKNLEVYPGLVDIHSHGCIGIDTMDEEGIAAMSVYQAKNGITSWLPTTMTMDYESIKRVTNRDISQNDGAEILGFHMEGPYINKKYKGAQNEAFIKNPDIKEFNTFKNISMVTIAPEMPGSMEFIKACNAVVSLGHTDADYATGVKAFENGAKCLTHTFNAMPPLHHRTPSIIGAAIDKAGYVQAICDGLHLHRSVIIALYRIFGSNRMILISDSMRATGLNDGEYEFGGQMIIVQGGVAKTQEGAIAGSTTNLFDCVKKAVEFGIPKEEAFKMASLTPAILLGKVNKGRLKVGADADIIAVDKDMKLLFSMSRGRIYKNLVKS